MLKLSRKISLLAVILSLVSIQANSSPRAPYYSYQDLIVTILKGKQSEYNIKQNLPSKNSLVSNDNKNLENCQSIHAQTRFLAVGGGGAPSYNEIALEKNVLYFQRTLKHMSFEPKLATIFFANGNNGQATLRYLDGQNRERFKVPKIPHLQAAATLENLQGWVQNFAKQPNNRLLFFYFTGHGSLNKKNSNDNALILWQEQRLSVRQFSTLLDKLPQNSQIVTMMAQCYSGSFANFIYQGGLPDKPLALQTRCGFFATISILPSVGCTPEVNEADYQDYSSSFFAGLSGINRIGQPVPSADYNHDRRVSYAEAHAFAKVDEKSSDLPVSTSEVWLQRQVTDSDFEKIRQQPIANLRKLARPEQQYVIDSLVNILGFDARKSYWQNFDRLTPQQLSNQETNAYQLRLIMELVNVGMAEKIHASNNSTAIAILSRLLACEASSWK